MTFDSTGTSLPPSIIKQAEGPAKTAENAASVASPTPESHATPAFILALSDEAQEYLSSLTQLQEMVLREEEPGLDILS